MRVCQTRNKNNQQSSNWTDKGRYPIPQVVSGSYGRQGRGGQGGRGIFGRGRLNYVKK